jgi:hypothetical protein
MLLYLKDIVREMKMKFGNKKSYFAHLVARKAKQLQVSSSDRQEQQMTKLQKKPSNKRNSDYFT